jgi:hypothetical protein
VKLCCLYRKGTVKLYCLPSPVCVKLFILPTERSMEMDLSCNEIMHKKLYMLTSV